MVTRQLSGVNVWDGVNLKQNITENEFMGSGDATQTRKSWRVSQRGALYFATEVIFILKSSVGFVCHSSKYRQDLK